MKPKKYGEKKSFPQKSNDQYAAKSLSFPCKFKLRPNNATTFAVQRLFTFRCVWLCAEIAIVSIHDQYFVFGFV